MYVTNNIEHAHIYIYIYIYIYICPAQARAPAWGDARLAPRSSVKKYVIIYMRNLLGWLRLG